MTDLQLADSFEREAEAALDQLPEITAIYSSPLTRCRRLAEKAAARFGQQVLVSSHWREMDFGSWEGQSWDSIPRAALDAWAEDFHGYDGHGGESVSALAARIKLGLGGVPDGALVVTHAGCIKAAAALHGLADGWDTQVAFGKTLSL